MKTSSGRWPANRAPPVPGHGGGQGRRCRAALDGRHAGSADVDRIRRPGLPGGGRARRPRRPSRRPGRAHDPQPPRVPLARPGRRVRAGRRRCRSTTPRRPSRSSTWPGTPRPRWPSSRTSASWSASSRCAPGSPPCATLVVIDDAGRPGPRRGDPLADLVAGRPPRPRGGGGGRRARRPGHDHLHLGHHRSAQGRDAHQFERVLGGARACTERPGDGHGGLRHGVLPAHGPHRRADDPHYQASPTATRSPPAPTPPRWRLPPGGASRDLLRRAPGVGEDLRRGQRRPGRRPREAGRLRAGPGPRGQGGRGARHGQPRPRSCRRPGSRSTPPPSPTCGPWSAWTASRSP